MPTPHPTLTQPQHHTHNSESSVYTSEREAKEGGRFCFVLFVIQRFSGLSLALNKDVCDWLRQTLNPSELEGERPIKDRADTHLL